MLHSGWNGQAEINDSSQGHVRCLLLSGPQYNSLKSLFKNWKTNQDTENVGDLDIWYVAE